MNRDMFKMDGLADLCKGTISTPVYSELHKAVTAIAIQFTGEPESAKDIASEYLIALWEKCEKGTVNTSLAVKPGALRKYCKKKQLSIQANLVAEAQAAEEWMTSMHSDAQIIADYTDELLLLTNHLEPIQKQVGELSLVHALSLQEISGIVNKSYNTVKSLRGLAIYHLKRLENLKKQNGKHGG